MPIKLNKETKERLAIIDSLRDFPQLQTKVIDKLGDLVSDEAVAVLREFVEINSADAITKQEDSLNHLVSFVRVVSASLLCVWS